MSAARAILCTAVLLSAGGCVNAPVVRDATVKRPAGYGYAFKIGFTWNPPGLSLAIVPVMKPEEVAATLIQK